jgi:hypothetical protein
VDTQNFDLLRAKKGAPFVAQQHTINFAHVVTPGNDAKDMDKNQETSMGNYACFGRTEFREENALDFGQRL